MMKKTILTVSLALTTMGLFAQTIHFDATDRAIGTVTKSGQQILPQAGDVAIGIDAASLLEYAGGIFSDSDANAPGFGYQDDIFKAPTIYFKYFLSEDAALRAKLHLGFNSDKTRTQVPEVGTTNGEVDDVVTNSSNGLGISVGYEMRRGYGRLQGFFGPEIGLGFSSSNKSYDWGNRISQYNTISSRKLKETNPSEFNFKVGGFAGVEYFVAPKLSIGGEVGLGLGFGSEGKSQIETEGWDSTNRDVRINRTKSGGGSSFSFSTKCSASLSVMFHF